jgi:hypothetical protein
LYTTCIPTARRDRQCASARAGGVLSAITTLGRRSGEVGTVVYTQYKRRNRSTLITYASQIRPAEGSGRKLATKPAFVMLRLCRVPASHIASDNAIMCDVLTRCKVYAGLQMRRTPNISYAVLLLTHTPFVTIMMRTRTAARSSFSPSSQNRSQLLIQTALAFLPLYPTWKRVLSSFDSRLPDIKQFHHTSYSQIPQGLTTSSPSLVDRWLRSILTRSRTLA